MYSWLTFYHSSHEVAKDHKPHMTELQSRIQTTRDHFNASREDIRSLMSKMLELLQLVRLFYEYFFDRELQSLAVLKLNCVKYLSKNFHVAIFFHVRGHSQTTFTRGGG